MKLMIGLNIARHRKISHMYAQNPQSNLVHVHTLNELTPPNASDFRLCGVKKTLTGWQCFVKFVRYCW